MQPSVKGTLFQNVSLEILEALESGTLSRADLESHTSCNTTLDCWCTSLGLSVAARILIYIVQM